MFVGFVWFGVCLGVKNEVVYEMSQELMEKLAVEAFQVAMVSHSESSFIWLVFFFFKQFHFLKKQVLIQHFSKALAPRKL